jgi:RNA polymerase sigma-70 factor (ECF subfamily)
MDDEIASDAISNERELVARLQSGDPKAIETLYVAYFDRLYSYVFHSVKRNHEAAEDIVQNVFVSAIRSATRFKGQSKIYTWLAGIAHHKIIDYYRREQREPHYNNNYLTKVGPSDLHLQAEYIESNAETLESKEMGDAVAEALSSLPLDYQQVLLFKYVEEMTVIEISKVMNRSAKSVEGLITRARRLLREQLSDRS